MELIMTKKQKSLFAIPSKCPPVVLCLVLGLLMSVLFSSSFVNTGIAPAKSSSSSSSNLIFKTTISINQLFFKLLSGSFSSDMARLRHDTSKRLPSQPPTQAHMPSLKDGVMSWKNGNRSEDGHPTIAGTSKQILKNKTAAVRDSSLSSFRKRQAHQHAYGVHDIHPPASSGRPQVFEPSPSHIINGNLTCDFSSGKWIQDDTYPLYDPGSCPFVEEAFNCHNNSRPDKEYTKWRWAPRDCHVPRFNGTDMLERLKGKRLVFVGDSLNRNQWESLLCMLRESLPDKTRVVQVQGNKISKLAGGYGFKFLDYDLRVELFVSPYLVDKEEASNEIKYVIRLDKMDKLERRWRKAHVLVFNTGHWWTSDKIGDGANCFQEGSEVHARLNVMVAYNKALLTWAKWVDRYIDPQNTTLFFRGYSPVHYIGGQWNSGGQCQNETQPIFKESFLTEYPDKMQALERVVQGMRVPVHVLNITRLSEFRKDAHPAVFGHSAQQKQDSDHQDCSHWCLPGLPDTWNELLSFALLEQQAGRKSL